LNIFSEVKELQTAYNAVIVECDDKKYNEISNYDHIRQQLDQLNRKFQSFLTQPKYLVPFLQSGRLIKVSLYSCIPIIYFVINHSL